MSYPQIKIIKIPGTHKEGMAERLNVIVRFLLTSRHSRENDWVASQYQPIDGLDKNVTPHLEVINVNAGEFCLFFNSLK